MAQHDNGIACLLQVGWDDDDPTSPQAARSPVESTAPVEDAGQSISQAGVSPLHSAGAWQGCSDACRHNVEVS